MEDWYIDSWSVMDGIVFASLRPRRDWTTASLPIPTTTVMLAPPDWRAVSVSRLSTSLAATHGPFQEGVLDDEGQELAFSSLDEIRGSVRRGYLAGALGIDEAGPSRAEAAGTPLPGQPSSGGARAWPGLWKSIAALGSVNARAAAADGALRVFMTAAGADALTRCLGEVVEAATGWDSATEDRRDWDDSAQWVYLHRGLGGELSPPHSSVLANPGASAAFSPARRTGLVFRLPAIRAEADGFPRLRTLGDQLMLSFSSRKYFEGRSDFESFTPLVVAAAILVAAVNPLWIPRGINSERILQPALTWLMQNALAPVMSETVEAMTEQLVHDIAWHKLGSETEKVTPSSERRIKFKELDNAVDLLRVEERRPLRAMNQY